jgi:hypothetical protein
MRVIGVMIISVAKVNLSWQTDESLKELGLKVT